MNDELFKTLLRIWQHADLTQVKPEHSTAFISALSQEASDRSLGNIAEACKHYHQEDLLKRARKLFHELQPTTPVVLSEKCAAWLEDCAFYV